MSERIVALLSGGDWFDASVEHLIVPREMNLEAERNARRKWYEEIYCPALQTSNKVEYIDLSRWLIERGARQATETEVEIFDDL